MSGLPLGGTDKAGVFLADRNTGKIVERSRIGLCLGEENLPLSREGAVRRSGEARQSEVQSILGIC